MSFKQTLKIIFFTGLFMQAAFIAPVMAESRMAGTIPVNASSHPPSPTKEDLNFIKLESRGILTTPTEGSLGRDLWRGTKRSLILTYLPQLPAQSQYRTLQSLSKRMLLTKADSSLIKQDQKPEAGNDITTLRIEKLLEMGLYKEALTLYTKTPEAPYHERLARAGILAALYNKELSLACLERKAIGDKFGDSSFWQNTLKICNAILFGQNLFNISAKSKKEPVFPDSEILEQIVKKDSYRFKPRKTEDFKELTPLETAVLTATNHFDLKTLTLPALSIDPVKEKLQPHVLGLLLKEPSISEKQAFNLMIRAVEQGLKPTENLTEYYELRFSAHFGKNRSKKTALRHYKSIKGRKRLFYLYHATKNAAKGKEQAGIIEEALDLAPEYSTIALWPFAKIIADIDPKNIDPKVIRYGLMILAETGLKKNPSWNNILENNDEKEGENINKKASSLYFSTLLAEKHMVKEDRQAIVLKKKLGKFSPHERDLLRIIYEKLDSGLKLNDDNANKAYENQKGLTSTFNYVMPSIGLLDSLESAKDEQRIGEIVLLSSVALHDVTPDEIYPELFREVIDGLVKMGLTKEARSLAREVMAGLSGEKIKGEN